MRASDMKPKHFQWALEGRVATITLDRPEKKNPLTFDSYAELRDTFRRLAETDDVKAVVCTGAGGQVRGPRSPGQAIGALRRPRTSREERSAQHRESQQDAEQRVHVVAQTGRYDPVGLHGVDDREPVEGQQEGPSAEEPCSRFTRSSVAPARDDTMPRAAGVSRGGSQMVYVHGTIVLE